MNPPVLDIELSLPPSRRWEGLRPYRTAVRELVSMYVRDLGDFAGARDELTFYRLSCISPEYGAEMDAVAELADLDPLEVLLANVYYDAFKHLMGCTAFAVDTAHGPLHARNLDWWTERNALSRNTVVARFLRHGAPLFEVVTWPGFIGALSGSAPGRFAVTLNAVLSDEPPGVAPPIGLVLRDLLTTADFNAARDDLARRPLACDCLLLLTGTRSGEMCVIERTPTRAEVRRTDSGAIVVTNDYRALSAPGWTGESTTVLQATSCGRYDRASGRVHAEHPSSAKACFAVLDDKGVKMDITVQQMVMSAAQGWLSARPGR